MKKSFLLILVLALCLAVFVGCDAGNYDDYDDGMPNSPENGVLTESAHERKIYYTVNANLTVDDVAQILSQIKSQLGSGEWVQSETQEPTYASIVLRVKTQRLDEFLQSVSSMGEVSHYTKQSTDVTEQYVSNEQQIVTLSAEKTALENLLQQSTNIADTLAITERLSQINYLLQNLSNEQQQYDSLVDYSVVTVHLYTKDAVNYNSFGAKLLDGLAVTWELLQGLVVFVICAIPFGAIVVGVIFLVKLIKKGKKQKSQGDEQRHQ